MLISPADARARLDLDRYHNLMLLGALDFEQVRSACALDRAGELAALALVVDQHGPLPDVWPTVMVVASDAESLTQLVRSQHWPAPATWSIRQRDLLPALEECLGQQHDPARGVCYYIYAADAPPQYPSRTVRRLTADDADTLDLEPCSLSTTAMRNWLRRGWRIFGAVERGQLLCHALAAYPIGDTEEVAAVYTAPQARRRGLASAVVAATAADILSRGLRAIYATTRANIPSQQVAASVGFTPLFETWDTPTLSKGADGKR